MIPFQKIRDSGPHTNMTADESSCGSEGKEERRKRKRYQIRMRADFRWQEADGSWHRGAGMTQNISAQGMYILADCAPPLGPIKVAVAVPPVKRNAHAKVSLRGKGTVLRVVPNAGFATTVALRLSNCAENGDSQPW